MRRFEYEKELENFFTQLKLNDISSSWLHLERAHILGQFFWREHFYVHILMFYLSIRVLNFREAIYQIPRILLAIPGSIFKKAPKGNVGTSRVGIFEEMPISNDLEKILNESSKE